MKALNTVVKILAALAAVAGAVYIVATYGEQIVAWAKRTLNALPKCPHCSGTPVDAEDFSPVEQAPETAADEAPVEESVAEEIPEEPAPEIVVADHEPVADDKDFAE